MRLIKKPTLNNQAKIIKLNYNSLNKKTHFKLLGQNSQV